MSKKIKIPKSKKRMKWNLFVNDNFIDESIFSSSHIEIFGNKKIEIDGCEGIYEYTEEYLKLRLKKGAVIICGSDFDISGFDNKVISVSGNIKSIEFCV